MPIYTVECADKKTGKSEVHTFIAASAGAAEANAIAEGKLVSRAYATHDDTHLLPDRVNELRQAVNAIELNHKSILIDLAAIRNSRMITQPITTIGWGILMSLVLAAILIAGTFAAISILGYSLAAIPRPGR